MADAPAAAPVEGAVSEQDVLLATKLYVPRPQPGFVTRPRLVETLDEGLARQLILVCAPAGFGKTALLADWTRSVGGPVAWLSLDAGDNDPVRFWRHAVAALDRVLPGIGERVAPLLGPQAPLSFQRLVIALINELTAPGASEILLVLDDYHLIGAQQVHEPLLFLLEHLPPGMHLALASRSDPPLPLARLRAAGQLTELRAGDLRFTAAEAAALLSEATGADLPDEPVAALAARTEGWVAGLQLAALSLRGQPEVTEFVAAFSGTHRYVLDYLAEEVLEHQSDQVRTFLLETSVLERLSGELCDAVTGRPGGQAMLEQIERNGLFLVPLDETRGWWRYHHLFADLLRARLGQDQPSRVPELHRSAAAWYAERGLADDAIRHAIAAGDTTWAARLIEQHFDELYFLRGEAATILRWISALPADLLRSRPRLLLAQALTVTTSGHIEAVVPLLDAAERAGPAEEPFEPTTGKADSLLANVPAHIALHRSYLAQYRGDADAAAAYASQALAETGEHERVVRSSAEGLLAVAKWLRGQLAEAERDFAAGLRAADQPTLAAFFVYHLGQVQFAQGRLREVASTCQQVLETSAVPGLRSPPAAGSAHVCLAEVAYQRNELDVASAHVTEGITLCRPLVNTGPLAVGLTTLAWIRQASGDPAGALDAIGEAMQAWPSPPGLLNPVPAQRARLLLAQGDIAAAASWTEENGLAAEHEPDYAHEPEYLVLARVLLAQDQPRLALALLDQLHAAATAQDRLGSKIEIQALRALALAASDDEAAAVDALAEALTLACPQGYVRVFADEGQPMADLLARLVTAQKEHRTAARAVPLDCLARVMSAFGGKTAAAGARPDAVAAIPGLVERLTAREREILELLAMGMPNPRIAKELVVSLDTVKKHVSRLLGKLGAANRTEAVARARQLGVIR